MVTANDWQSINVGPSLRRSDMSDIVVNRPAIAHISYMSNAFADSGRRGSVPTSPVSAEQRRAWLEPENALGVVRKGEALRPIPIDRPGHEPLDAIDLPHCRRDIGLGHVAAPRTGLRRQTRDLFRKR